jgi:hypothetical protein
MKFVKRPVVIEAFQFLGHESGPDLSWFIAAVNAGTIKRKRTERIAGSDWLEIHTPEGHMSAGLRDWIIRGVKGEIYPCKPDIFDETYAPYDAPMGGYDAATKDKP